MQLSCVFEEKINSCMFLMNLSLAKAIVSVWSLIKKSVLEGRPPPGFALRQNNSSYQDMPLTARGTLFLCIVARKNCFNPALKICSKFVY
jgi:hypothetical protein